MFSLPEVGLGLVAECGGLFRGPRALPLNVARELLLTGIPLDAPRAHELGLVNRLAEPGQALEAALELAGQIVAHAPLAVTETLAAVEAIYAEEDAAQWAVTDRVKTTVRASADAAEGIAAFTEKRAPVWSGQ